MGDGDISELENSTKSIDNDSIFQNFKEKICRDPTQVNLYNFINFYKIILFL